tara:strand:+ start:426 stop:653 length:228 start_codon:yes stop_codon:yes gene_type:complete
MTIEFQNELKAYSQEDVQIAKTKGCINICDTKSGLITIESLGSFFQAYNMNREQLTGIMNTEKMENWLMNQYTIA